MALKALKYAKMLDLILERKLASWDALPCNRFQCGDDGVREELNPNGRCKQFSVAIQEHRVKLAVALAKSRVAWQASTIQDVLPDEYQNKECTGEKQWRYILLANPIPRARLQETFEADAGTYVPWDEYQTNGAQLRSWTIDPLDSRCLALTPDLGPEIETLSVNELTVAILGDRDVSLALHALLSPLPDGMDGTFQNVLIYDVGNGSILPVGKLPNLKYAVYLSNSLHKGETEPIVQMVLSSSENTLALRPVLPGVDFGQEDITQNAPHVPCSPISNGFYLADFIPKPTAVSIKVPPSTKKFRKKKSKVTSKSMVNLQWRW
eukprot:Clim_evm54s149 gene=Clim_evmTU54s149